MSINYPHPCAHAPCVCEVQEAASFCSEHCRYAAASDSDSCACVHLECAAEPVAIETPLAFA
jgi:hypothetical protein